MAKHELKVKTSRFASILDQIEDEERRIAFFRSLPIFFFLSFFFLKMENVNALSFILYGIWRQNNCNSEEE